MTGEPSKKATISLFSGVGGLDLGLALAGMTISEACESWQPARRVLEHRFPGRPVAPDISAFEPKQPTAVLAAGFPCTNLSHMGDKTGIGGAASGLVEHVFRLAQQSSVEWILLENVPNLLALHRGEGIRYVVGRLEALGFHWAYRTVDSRFTGVPQRRPRVLITAWRQGSPAVALLGQRGKQLTVREEAEAYGFYWTEGRHSVGLVADAIPTLKGGSTLGLPSAPAVWIPSRDPGAKIVLPSIAQGERLQGLDPGWTEAAVCAGEPDMRWKLVGNAVTVGVGHWLGERVMAAREDDDPTELDNLGRVDTSKKWPSAAWGGNGEAWASPASQWPVLRPYTPLDEVIDAASARPLSHRATAGFLSRLAESGLPINPDLYSDLEEHLTLTRPLLTRSARGRRTSSGGSKDSWASSPAVRRRMQATGPRDTRIEIALRRSLTRLGLRYRLQMRPETDLRWRMDVVFKRPKVAVDIRGCFWHVCPLHGTKPKQNADRWQAKLEANVTRDRRVVDALKERGWCVVVVWEHENPDVAASTIAAVVADRTASPHLDGCVIEASAP